MMLRLLGLLALLVLIAGSLLLGRDTQQLEPAAADAPPGAQPGYSARDAEIVETGPDGRPRYRLHAERIVQQPRDASVALQEITMTYRTEAGRDWQLTAERGRVPENARRIELEGSVVATGLPLRSRELARITTDRLSFDTQTERLITRAPVSVDWSGQRLTARGLVADLKEQHLSLESDVHGRFTP